VTADSGSAMPAGGHIFLVGFMGSGKSTVGCLLAREFGMPLIDLDAVVERTAGRTVAELFAEEGEPRFRQLEHDALASLSEAPPSIVACGGGAVLLPENRGLMQSLGHVVYLEVSAGEALARIGDVAGRPLLASGGPGAAETLLSAREVLYRATSDVAADTGGKPVEQVATEVAAALRTAGYVS
jgi:shikimate kinase